MSYATQTNRPNPAAMIGALGVPAAFGVLLIIGLAITATRSDDGERLIGWDFPSDPPVIEPLPIPEVPPTEVVKTDPTQQPKTPAPDYTPTRPDSPININLGPTAPIGKLPTLGTDIVGPGLDAGTGLGEITIPTPEPLPDPIAASPRGNTGGWITERDYRTRWISEGLSGVAGFTLNISAKGRVSDCTITRSTGHDVLDQATCRLLEKNAQFNPARDAKGNKVPGTYRSSVNWKIPE